MIYRSMVVEREDAVATKNLKRRVGPDKFRPRWRGSRSHVMRRYNPPVRTMGTRGAEKCFQKRWAFYQRPPKF